MRKEFICVSQTCRGCGKTMTLVPNIKRGTKITGLHETCWDKVAYKKVS